jgi:hypothetical protein
VGSSSEVRELLDLLWASARQGKVTAQRTLLEYYRSETEGADDGDFAELDELAPRRRASRKAS